MRAYSTNYLRDGRRPIGWGLLHRGFWLSGRPRLMLVCRLFEHRPVVDGSDSPRRSWRWVECSRCGIRPDPQGAVDPARWAAGARYTGEFGPGLPEGKGRPAAVMALKNTAGFYPPGPWPASPKGTLGGEVVVGRRSSDVGQEFGFELKVGNKGSEHTLAASFHLLRLGSLYLHTQRFGAGLVHWLNPVGYESKVIAVGLHGSRLRWQWWVGRDASEPHRVPFRRRLRHGSVELNPLTLTLGPKRCDYSDVGAPRTVRVRFPHGDEVEVRLQLQRVSCGRRRGRKRMSWSVYWECPGGLPTEPGGRGRVFGSDVQVSAASEAVGVWVEVAVAKIREQYTAIRADNGWVPVPEGATW